MTSRLILSFWDLCLDNLPQGCFERSTITVHGPLVVQGDLEVHGPLTVDGAIRLVGNMDADGPIRERDYSP
jgi:hypothetical protein